MMKMCRYALITALAIFLAGCAGLREQPAPVEEAKPQPQQPAQPQPTVPTVPAVPSVPAQLGRLSIRISSRVSRRRACVIMTGTARFSRWWGRCCRRVGSMPAVFCWLTA